MRRATMALGATLLAAALAAPAGWAAGPKAAPNRKKSAPVPRAAPVAPPALPAPPKPAYALVEVDPPGKAEERLWRSKCASCHGRDGKGDTGQGRKWQIRDLSAASWQTARTDEQLRARMRDGGASSGASQEEMAAFSDLTPAQLDQLVHYLRWTGAPRQAP